MNTTNKGFLCILTSISIRFDIPVYLVFSSHLFARAYAVALFQTSISLDYPLHSLRNLMLVLKVKQRREEEE